MTAFRRVKFRKSACGERKLAQRACKAKSKSKSDIAHIQNLNLYLYLSHLQQWPKITTGTVPNQTTTQESIEERAVTMEENQKQRYENAGQSQVFWHFEKLSDAEKSELLAQLKSIEVERLEALYQSASSCSFGTTSDHSGTITPFAGTVARSTDNLNSETGMKAIENGQVASLVLAGGQGTRLGFSGPKGCLDIGLPSGRTLFELMALRICKLQLLTNGIIPFYIMTSPLNHEETLSFFERKKYFGLEPGNVFFFQQGMLPCLTEEGKIIMESAGKVAMAPDGNGGIYPSLVASGALDDMTNRGVQYLHVFSIDNALVKPADPKFIGYCIDQKADCGNKVVWKVDAHEKVGVVAERSGRPCIVEYSEITREMAEKTDSSGRLVFGAGNICNHFYTIDFVKNKILPNMGSLYHIANKKIPYYDEVTNKTITPDSNNGIKLETFIFDVFPLSERMAVLDVEREEEFAPVKNKAGSPSDSPDTARSMISALAKKWVRDAGGILTGELDAICEISPLTSYAGENLEFLQDKEVACPFHI